MPQEKLYLTLALGLVPSFRGSAEVMLTCVRGLRPKQQARHVVCTIPTEGLVTGS